MLNICFYLRFSCCLFTLALVASCSKGNDDNRNQVVDTDPVSCCGNTYVYEIIGADTVLIPNAFTPNGDGFNDEFFVHTTSGVTLVDLTVSNDTGLVYRFDNANGFPRLWDGTNATFGNGEDLAEGTYNFTIIGLSGNNVSDTITGKICLLRDGNLCPQNKGFCIFSSFFAGFGAASIIDSTNQSQYEPPFCN